MPDERGLEKRVASLLEGRGFEFERQPIIGGLQPDFVISAPDGRQFVVETKDWAPTQENAQRAFEQARAYAEATHADRAFIVLRKTAVGSLGEDVVDVQDVLDQIEAAMKRPAPVKGAGGAAAGKPARAKGTARKTQKRVPSRRPAPRVIFAAMPFDRAYDDVFFVAMRAAAEGVGAACTRVDQEEFTGDVVARIQERIRESSAVIVDLSEARPNVLYEAGYAHALDLPVVHISSTPLDQLPFDVRNWNTLRYEKGQTHAFADKLGKRLKAILKSQ